jgi:hypothetical protein
MIEYLGHTIRIYQHRIAGPLPWMAWIGWPGVIFAWKTVYDESEQAVIEQAKRIIEREGGAT